MIFLPAREWHPSLNEWREAFEHKQVPQRAEEEKGQNEEELGCCCAENPPFLKLAAWHETEPCWTVSAKRAREHEKDRKLWGKT